MTDDLANDWGKRYCLPETKRGSRGSCEVDVLTVFKELMQRLCENKFFVTKCCPSGTDANLWSMFEATGSMRSSCGVAAGSYIAGVGTLQSWTSVYFCIKRNVCRIMHPSQTTDIAREVTLPLPYFITESTEMSDIQYQSELESLEMHCLNEIHLRCLQFKLEGKPLKALLLELILACNGGELSNRFLKKLGLLAKHHEFCIIVDEIMTGGRAGPKLLLTLTAPSEFQDAVAFITLGKWLGIGVVLENLRRKPLEEEEMMPSRGPSTSIRLDNALDCLRYIEQHLSTIQNRRESVLKKMRVTELEAWGKGLIVFVPKRRSDISRGLKNRYLPMLANAPICTIPISGKSDPKSVINNQMGNDVYAWILHSKTAGTKSNRILVERLVDITQENENNLIPNHDLIREHFVGRYEIQIYLKDRLSENCFAMGLIQNHSPMKEKSRKHCLFETNMTPSVTPSDTEYWRSEDSTNKTSHSPLDDVSNVDDTSKFNVTHGRGNIQERKSVANYTVGMAETIGILNYKYVKGKKRLRRLNIREDCSFPFSESNK